jgi:hypothetical protein
MPIRVNIDSMTSPHAPIVSQLSIHKAMNPAARELKWPIRGRWKAKMPRVYVNERKRYARRDVRVRMVRVVRRVKMWP